ncbi:uncharacterized protein FIESC28_06137 [Fusarium coffeatum]|uniref:Clr5 domain-containing protein n=1 Tax=Fusarium coffeatum TaxID=231269 RepID=A0A366RMJ2_9HYPO|nr:uncharacterized protein FIESC28_06137 [Fusarium coffeatum]RBR18364.1 hypothetical protein FIESC28_06137 [Fusarium coffeatum]
MSRALRIPDTRWEAHKETIQSLYLEQNKTVDEIISFMAENHQFYASKKQYIRKVTVNWKLRKNTKKEEWEQASALILKRKAEGKMTQLTIHGKIIPDKRSKRETRRYAPKDTLESPVLPHIESVAVQTPPTLHQDITYFNLPWFDLKTQLRSHMLGNGLHPILDRAIASIHDPTASSPSTSRDQVTMEGFVGSLLLSIKSGSTSKSDHDLKVPAMLESLDEEIPFSYRNKHSTELQTGQSDILGPWSRLFLSMAFLSTNNRWQDKTLIKFLELAISYGLLQDLKQALSLKGPTIKLFSVALLSAAIDIPERKGFDFAQYLLQQGVNPNSAYSTRTPLQRAVASERKGAVQLLLDHGADPFASFPTLQPQSPSHMGLYDSKSLAEALVDRSYSLTRDPTPDRMILLKTPLVLAIKAKDEERVRQLLQAGADTNLFHPKDLSPLHVAVRCKNAAMVSLLIEFGADPNLFCRAEMETTLTIARSDLSPGYPIPLGTPLQNAVGLNDLTIVKRLLQAGADPNGTICLDMSANNEDACYECHFALNSLQIASKLDGCYLNYTNRRENTFKLFELLLKAGAGVDTRHTMQSTTLQYWGADVNAPPAAQLDGKTALEAAAGAGDVDLVELLLREGAICNDPASILQGAFASGCQNLVDFLIRHFAKTDLSALDIDDNWVEYLEASAKSGNVRLVDMVLENCVDKNTERFEKHAINAMEAAVAHDDNNVLGRLLLSGVNPNADGRACRILNSAIIGAGYAVRCFTLLMSKFAALKSDLDQPLPGEPTPLWTAISRNNTAVAQCLIISGVDVNRPSLCIDKVKGNRLETPMADAIRCVPCMEDDSDHACPVDLLIMSGANVDRLVDGSMTALLLALRLGQYKVAEKLLLHGANPNIRDLNTGMHAFDMVLTGMDWWPDISFFKSLMGHGFEFEGEFGSGTTIQAVFGKPSGLYGTDDCQIVELVVRLLIGAGIEVNAPTTEETPMTALQYAIDANHEELVDILLAAGADIHVPAFWKKGKTALQAACNTGNLELVRSLVKQGLEINERPASHNGATALQFAAMQGHIDVAIFLLENGALVNAPAALVEGRTALQGAAEHGRLDMIFLLLENDQDDGLEERCQDAAKFAEKESRFEIAQILREYRRSNVHDHAYIPYGKLTE